jgi:hypothetical protein
MAGDQVRTLQQNARHITRQLPQRSLRSLARRDQRCAAINSRAGRDITPLRRSVALLSRFLAASRRQSLNVMRIVILCGLSNSARATFSLLLAGTGFLRESTFGCRLGRSTGPSITQCFGGRAKQFGPGMKKKKCLVLDSEVYRYQKFCSDDSASNATYSSSCARMEIPPYDALNNWKPPKVSY